MHLNPSKDQIEQWDLENLRIIKEILETKSLNALKGISEMSTGQLERLATDFSLMKKEIENERQRRKNGKPKD